LGTAIGLLFDIPDDTSDIDSDDFEEESFSNVGYVQALEYLTHREHRGFNSLHYRNLLNIPFPYSRTGY
jgi:hypothetical protein